jgi:hypothetical protein
MTPCDLCHASEDANKESEVSYRILTLVTIFQALNSNVSLADKNMQVKDGILETMDV